MTKFLASVKNFDETKIVIDTPVDIIDLKNPNLGALGKIEHNEMIKICEYINHNKIVSSTIGDIENSKEKIQQEVDLLSQLKIDIIKIGFFDESKFSGSDKEWVSKCVRKGIKLTYEKNLEVIHPSRATFKEISQKYRRTYGGWFKKYGCKKGKIITNLFYFFWTFRVPFKALHKIFFYKINIYYKFGALIVLIYIRIIRTHEHILLSLGSNPRR